MAFDEYDTRGKIEKNLTEFGEFITAWMALGRYEKTTSERLEAFKTRYQRELQYHIDEIYGCLKGD